MVLFIPYKSQFLLAKQGSQFSDQTISFAVFLFFPAIFPPVTIEIRIAILLSTYFHQLYTHPPPSKVVIFAFFDSIVPKIKH